MNSAPWDEFEDVEAKQKITKLLTEAHWLIEYARCQGEYGLGEEWTSRYESWKKELGVE